MIFNFESLTKIPNDLESTCFACGKKNPYGFQLEFYSDGVNVYSKYLIPGKYSGWSNLTHGGILATLLDETMAWTAIYLEKKYILTKYMNLSYKKPILSDSLIFLRGFIKESISIRERLVYAEILNESGEVCTEATGGIVLFNAESFRKLNLTTPEFLENFNSRVLDRI